MSTFLHIPKFLVWLWQLLLIVTCAVFSSGTASAEKTASSADDLAVALDLCSSRTSLKGHVDAALSQAGWIVQPKPDYDRRELEPLRAAMFSTHFVANFDSSTPEQMHYSLGNSVFMMGSILGNSAIRKTPLVYQNDGRTLLLVARELDSPYCVLTGDHELAGQVLRTEALASPKTGSENMPPLRDHIESSYKGALVILFITDLAKLREKIGLLTATPASEPILPAEMYPVIVNAIQSTNIVIKPIQ